MSTTIMPEDVAFDVSDLDLDYFIGYLHGIDGVTSEPKWTDSGREEYLAGYASGTVKRLAKASFVGV